MDKNQIKIVKITSWTSKMYVNDNYIGLVTYDNIFEDEGAFQFRMKNLCVLTLSKIINDVTVIE